MKCAPRMSLLLFGAGLFLTCPLSPTVAQNLRTAAPVVTAAAAPTPAPAADSSSTVATADPSSPPPENISSSSKPATTANLRSSPASSASSGPASPPEEPKETVLVPQAEEDDGTEPIEAGTEELEQISYSSLGSLKGDWKILPGTVLVEGKDFPVFVHVRAEVDLEKELEPQGGAAVIFSYRVANSLFNTIVQEKANEIWSAKIGASTFMMAPEPLGEIEGTLQAFFGKLINGLYSADNQKVELQSADGKTLVLERAVEPEPRDEDKQESAGRRLAASEVIKAGDGENQPDEATSECDPSTTDCEEGGVVYLDW